MIVTVARVNELAEQNDAVSITASDLDKLVLNGRLIAISKDRKKISTYVYRVDKRTIGDVPLLFISSRFEGDDNSHVSHTFNLTKAAYHHKVVSRNLPPFSNRPAVQVIYQSESFIEWQEELAFQRQLSGATSCTSLSCTTSRC